MKEASIAFVYALIDAKGTPRYVGSTVDVEARLRYHWSHRRQQRHVVSSWLNELDEPPLIAVLRGVAPEDRYAAEADWTLYLRRLGYPLLNKHVGAKPSAETRAKLATANLGRKMSTEARAKMSTAHRGRPKSAEHRRKIGEASRGRVKSPETRAKISAALTGKPLSEVHRAKIGAAQQGIPKSETRREALRGKTHSAVTRVKISAAVRRHQERKRAEQGSVI
ncbi:NUMOD3 domain-containing DNA-binding protein [Streptomyces hokutonensis]|uniref:NUMOD3 domain-containing DNA-binding protein n=1 Tax=Streptomyces hokutonensis TaxID=1306990 RepID=UPI0003685AA1|nr:NUMOD3 domain-containing DNA-binding protein [Streptomyces hokutonensis]